MVGTLRHRGAWGADRHRLFSIRYRRGSPADRSGEPDAESPAGADLDPDPRRSVHRQYSPGALFLFARMRTPPDMSQTVYVVAKQWMWKAQHAGGQREINTLHVPLGRADPLTMTSEDVIHSFYVPAFRVKQDVLPGRYTQLWFTATQIREFRTLLRRILRPRPRQDGRQIVVHAPRGLCALAGRPYRTRQSGRSRVPRCFVPMAAAAATAPNSSGACAGSWRSVRAFGAAGRRQHGHC